LPGGPLHQQKRVSGLQRRGKRAPKRPSISFPRIETYQRVAQVDGSEKNSSPFPADRLFGQGASPPKEETQKQHRLGLVDLDKRNEK
jgi:hypothetical protein